MNAASDETLLRVLENTGNRCLAIVQMTPEQRRNTGNKGAASPNEFGTVCAWLYVKTARELIHRRLLPADWLDDVLA